MMTTAQPPPTTTTINNIGSSSSGSSSNSNNKDDFNRLQTSNQIILQALRNDENSPSSDLYQRMSCSSPPSSSSTITNNKSPPLYIESDNNNKSDIHGSCTYASSIPLPSFLRSEINKAKLSSYMGLLSEANLAWFSVDDKVYIWGYDNSSSNKDEINNNDFCMYTSKSRQCVVSVGIVRPKKGIFKSCVEWCLVVTTAEDATLLAITFNNTLSTTIGSLASTLQLHITPFCMNTELNPLYPIKGTSNGRIFLGGHDGSLYEMEYATDDKVKDSMLLNKAFDLIMLPFKPNYRGGLNGEEREPKRKCRKINHSLDNSVWISRIVPTFVKSVASTLSGNYTNSNPIIDMQIDNSRRLIYMLSSNGTITCYKYSYNDKHIVCLSVLSVPYLAKQYLQCVIQSWISSPPSTSSQIQFAGSGKAISSNIHNVEGARKWLEAAKKSQNNDVLYPLNIHIVSDYTSQFISLVAVTKLGLRYYFTYDCDSLLLCHIKSPPMNKDEGVFPFGYDVNASWIVNNSYWKDGVLLTTLDGSNVVDHTFNTSASEKDNNVLMTIVPNCTLVQDQEGDLSIPGTTIITPPSHTNSSEVVLYPNVSSASYTVPGGSTWDISASLEMKRDLLVRYLFHASTTPSDADLNLITSTLPSPAFLSSIKDTKALYSTDGSLTTTTNGSFLSCAMNFIVGTLKRKREEMLPIWTSTMQNEYKYTFAESCLTEQWLLGNCASVDIPKWMKSPSISSFHPLTTQHLALDASSSYIVMNAGGVHTFDQTSIVQQYRKALRLNQASKIHAFFHDYGFQEGCVMSLYLALTADTTDGKQLALRAALTHANSPKLNDELEFQSSSLHDALISLFSRLIRPFWLKPIVIVDHNQVHMLLDKELLHILRKPLLSFQSLMRQVFLPALQSVPQCPTQMDIDTVEPTVTTFVMNAVQIQQSRDTLSAVQKDSIAKYQEETSIHNLYRLLSKTVQFLNVLEMLLDHRHMVEWGLLHSVTCMQFVTSVEGHDRMQTLLLNMVTKEGVEDTNKNLVRVLGKSAYLYFSLGDRYAYQGFDAVQHAKKDVGSLWKDHAGTFFCKAAKFWKSPSLVVGLTPLKNTYVGSSSHGTPTSKEEQIASNYTSPLAKAAAALYSVEHYRGIVELCLVTAANFGGSLGGLSIQNEVMEEAVGTMSGVFQWEIGLYSRSAVQEENQLVVHGSTTNEPNPIISPADARTASYNILFYYLRRLLLKSSTEAEKILNTCVSVQDSHFQQCLFQYLFQQTHMESLLRISSPSLEQYLIDKKNAMVLYRYYIIHNRNEDAADVMVEYACSKEDLDLESRTDCLSRAAMIISTNSPKSLQVKQMLENVKIQAIILKRLSNMSPSSDDNVLESLKNQMVDISTLLNDYAAEYRMFDICLRILNAHRVMNPEYTEKLWNLLLCEWIPQNSQNAIIEELLRKEFGDQSHDEKEGTFDDANSWSSLFQSHFIELGRILYGTGADYTFPIGFLIRKLVILQSSHEEVASVSSTSPIWLLLPFLEIHVSYEKLLEALEDWLGVLEQELGSNEKQRMDCLKNIANILYHWVKTASSQQTRNSSSVYNLSGENADALSQLNQSLATGLRQKIQGWKTTIESMIGKNVSNTHNTFTDTENLLKSFY